MLWIFQHHFWFRVSVPTTLIHEFLLLPQSLHQDECQNCIDDLEKAKNQLKVTSNLEKTSFFFAYVQHGQRHCHGSSPNRFVFQIPGHLINTSVAECMSRHCITTLERQRLTKNEIIVRTICTTTSDLSTCCCYCYWDDDGRWREREEKKSIMITRHRQFI